MKETITPAEKEIMLTKAIINIRKDLQAEYPSQPFKVIRTCCGLIYIEWSKGPKSGEVDTLVRRYETWQINNENTGSVVTDFHRKNGGVHIVLIHKKKSSMAGR